MSRICPPAYSVLVVDAEPPLPLAAPKPTIPPMTSGCLVCFITPLIRSTNASPASVVSIPASL
ncbi:hypothetical protein BG74_00550 [Sodalis-like endosymbiont of Proechinophthirus fluctus]|nr:hypothetical protein BG74_00550 [Sodalis-like endosymbiont of Proechinophthirus fluctus]